MRLICPNCDAQYEVADDAIPDAGRDVQCSSCGHAWFQFPPETEAAIAAEEALFDAPPVDVAPADVGVAAETDAEVAGGDADAIADAVAGLVANDDEPASDAAPDRFAEPEPLQRRSLDESVLAVLKEEADREAAQRKSETPAIPETVETQPDLGLESAAAPAALGPVARRIAQLKGLHPDAQASADTAPPAVTTRAPKGRDLLPDIEEIKSTLRASADRYDDDDDNGVMSRPAEEPLAAPGFRNGFMLMLLLAAVLVALYVMAPKIAQQMPAAAGAMEAYVSTVDSIRLWIDGLMRNAASEIKPAN